MTDLEAAEFYVKQHDQRNEQRKAEGLLEYGEPSHVTFARALIAVTAERDKLRAACEYVRRWLDEYDTERELHPALRQTLDAALKPTI
jgi:hypothetical protein